jgi:hypothetical protein
MVARQIRTGYDGSPAWDYRGAHRGGPAMQTVEEMREKVEEYRGEVRFWKLVAFGTGLALALVLAYLFIREGELNRKELELHMKKSTAEQRR